jgi:hypothetical protein
MRQTARRPHLAEDGTLCDQEPPCVHERSQEKSRSRLLIQGSIIGALIGIVGATFVVHTFLHVLGTVGLMAMIIVSFGAGIYCFRR